MKKLKKQYRNSEEIILHSGRKYVFYPNVKSGSIKLFSVHQERSLTALHKVEYKKEYNLKIRGKRDGGIPNPWDDYRSHVYDVSTSWKHNSKRKKQYYK